MQVNVRKEHQKVAVMSVSENPNARLTSLDLAYKPRRTAEMFCHENVIL